MVQCTALQTRGGQVWHLWQTRPHLCCAIDVTIFAQTIHSAPPLAWKGLTWEEGPQPAMHSQPTSHCSSLQKYRNEKILKIQINQNTNWPYWEGFQRVTCLLNLELSYTHSAVISELSQLEIYQTSEDILVYQTSASVSTLYPSWVFNIFWCIYAVSLVFWRVSAFLVYQTWAFLGISGLNLEPLPGVSELVSGSTITRVIIPASSGLPPPRKSAIKWMPFLTNSAAKWSPAQKSARPDHQRSLTSSMQKQSLGRG